MAWSASKVQISSAVAVVSTTLQHQTTGITLAPGETAHIRIHSTTSAATSNLLVHVQTTLDDTSEDWDTVSYGSPIEIPSTTTITKVPITVSGVYKFRLAYSLVTGTQQTNVSAWYRKDGQ